MLELKPSLRFVSLAVALTAGVAIICLPTDVRAETLNQALAAAYEYNPQLDAERARLRAVD